MQIPVQSSVRRSAVLTEVARLFCLFPQANTETVHQNNSKSLPFTSVTFYHPPPTPNDRSICNTTCVIENVVKQTTNKYINSKIIQIVIINAMQSRKNHCYYQHDPKNQYAP
jgi:hypothetical protein